MFRPRHAYRSPITNRYRGKARGCPVFNNITDINSNMVEQHDECLECLAKIKNRTDLYRTLADNNKPSNNVIKSLQRLSSSASNNRLKTCLQFLIIKVNEKSIPTPQHTTTTTTTTTTIVTSEMGSSSNSSSPKSTGIIKESEAKADRISEVVATTKHLNNKRQKLHNQQHKQRQQQKSKHNQLPSPPQDQVSSTQDQISPPTQDDHDCQTSPMMLVTTQSDDEDQIKTPEKQIKDNPPENKNDEQIYTVQTQSSPSVNYVSATTTTTTTNTSPSHIENNDGVTISSYSTKRSHSSSSSSSCGRDRRIETKKRRKIHNSSDHETSSTVSWSSSLSPPPSPLSTSSISSGSSQTSSSCSSSISPSPSPLSSPDIVNELKGPRLKLSEEKIRKIQRRPILFDDYYTEHSFASTPTTSSGCSPGQHSNTTQNSDQSRINLPSSNMVIHMFQAPPRFVNNLKPCNLPTKPQEVPAVIVPPVITKEMLNCAICGIKDDPINISKTYGQNSCSLCTDFFRKFIKKPEQFYCAQDGDCLMAVDSRCKACWIKICLQKLNVLGDQKTQQEYLKTKKEYLPRLLSSPNVALITIDTSPYRSPS